MEIESRLFGDEAGLAEAVGLLCSGDDSGLELIETVVRASPEALSPFHKLLIDAEPWFWLWTPLWFAATEESAARLVELVDAGTAMSERWLCALGSSRTQTAAAAFARWTAEPPPVAAKLVTPIARYALEGGWEVDAGGIRPLSSLAAYALTATGSGRPLAGSMPADERCPRCGLELVRRLDVDLDDPRLIDLGLAGHGRVVALSCMNCGCFADIFTEYRADGTAAWSVYNRTADNHDAAEDFEGLEPPGRLGLGPRRPSPVAGFAWDGGGSTLGGLPDWMEDFAAYPSCPNCRRTMYFLAMLSSEDLWNELAEGCDYVFFCTSGCRIAAVVYQQG